MGEESDWRLTDQQEYLQGKTLHWRRWVPPKKTWDHDHCAFCWARICDVEDGQPEAWTTEDNYWWVCKKCGEDFRETLQWTLIEAG